MYIYLSHCFSDDTNNGTWIGMTEFQRSRKTFSRKKTRKISLAV